MAHPGGMISAAPVTYLSGGKQQVAITAAARSLFAFESD